MMTFIYGFFFLVGGGRGGYSSIHIEYQKKQKKSELKKLRGVILILFLYIYLPLVGLFLEK